MTKAKPLLALALIFVVFLIFNDPTGSGAAAEAFGRLLAQFVGALLKFITALLSGIGGGGTTA